MSRRPRPLALALLVPLALAGLVACGRLGASAEASDGELLVVGGQVAVPPNPDQAAARFLIQNSTAVDDELVGASSPDAESVAIHRSEIDAEGRAVMSEVTALAVPARSEVTFEPGGLHVMLTGLHQQLEAGDTVSLRLEFAEAGPRRVELDVVDGASMAMGEEHDHDG
jgi:copper(I)-binding protein